MSAPSPNKDLPSNPQSQSPSRSHSCSRSQSPTQRPRLPIRTYHCTFCKQILLATTRDIARLPRRSRGEGLDNAIIMPLRTTKSKSRTKHKQVDEDEEEDDDEEDSAAEHYTILLSTTLAASSASIIRRRDGFEKRLLLRCGRCRVVCGYVLDNVHFPAAAAAAEEEEDEDDGVERERRDGDEEGDREAGGGEAEVVYILPGAVMETGVMMADTRNKVDMAEWEGWEKLVAAS